MSSLVMSECSLYEIGTLVDQVKFFPKQPYGQMRDIYQNRIASAVADAQQKMKKQGVDKTFVRDCLGFTEMAARASFKLEIAIDKVGKESLPEDWKELEDSILEAEKVESSFPVGGFAQRIISNKYTKPAVMPSMNSLRANLLKAKLLVEIRKIRRERERVEKLDAFRSAILSKLEAKGETKDLRVQSNVKLVNEKTRKDACVDKKVELDVLIEELKLAVASFRDISQPVGETVRLLSGTVLHSLEEAKLMLVDVLEQRKLVLEELVALDIKIRLLESATALVEQDDEVLEICDSLGKSLKLHKEVIDKSEVKCSADLLSIKQSLEKETSKEDVVKGREGRSSVAGSATRRSVSLRRSSSMRKSSDKAATVIDLDFCLERAKISQQVLKLNLGLLSSDRDTVENSKKVLVQVNNLLKV